MIGTIVSSILGAVFGGTTQSVGNAVTNSAKWIAILAMLPVAWKWYEGHQNDVAVSFTYSQALWLLVIFVVIQIVAHKSNVSQSQYRE